MGDTLEGAPGSLPHPQMSSMGSKYPHAYVCAHTNTHSLYTHAKPSKNTIKKREQKLIITYCNHLKSSEERVLNALAINDNILEDK